VIQDSLNTFRDRLVWVLGPERKITPWAKSLGFTTGMVSRINAGNVPRPDVLAIIARVEGVNLNWLLDGAGKPYHYAQFFEADDAREYVQGLLADEGWTFYRIEGPRGHFMVVLTLPSSVRVNERDVPYTAVEIILGQPKLPWDATMFEAGGGAYDLRIDREAAMRLTTGELGPFELVGDADHAGLLESAEPFDNAMPGESPTFQMEETSGVEYAADPIGEAYRQVARTDPAAANRRLLELLDEILNARTSREDAS
jgi:hypothetical protein